MNPLVWASMRKIRAESDPGSEIRNRLIIQKEYATENRQKVFDEIIHQLATVKYEALEASGIGIAEVTANELAGSLALHFIGPDCFRPPKSFNPEDCD